MNVKVLDNRLIEFSSVENGTQNENEVQTLNIEVPEKYNDFDKKIVFITEGGTYWDYIQENGKYLLSNKITKYLNVEFYIWLLKTENEKTLDFRTKTYPLFFYKNTIPISQIPDDSQNNDSQNNDSQNNQEQEEN